MDREPAVVAYFKDIAAMGMEAAFRNHGTDEATWWICGMGDARSQLPALSAAFAKIFDARGRVIVPQRMISKDDLVAVEGMTDCKLSVEEGYGTTVGQTGPDEQTESVPQEDALLMWFPSANSHTGQQLRSVQRWTIGGLARHERDPRVRRRLLAIANALNGMSRSIAAKLAGLYTCRRCAA